MPATFSRHCLRSVRQWLSPLPEPLPLQRFRNLAQRLRRVLEIGQNGIDGSSNYAKQTPSSSGSSNRTQRCVDEALPDRQIGRDGNVRERLTPPARQPKWLRRPNIRPMIISQCEY
jgi:hypothetical protein